MVQYMYRGRANLGANPTRARLEGAIACHWRDTGQGLSCLLPWDHHLIGVYSLNLRNRPLPWDLYSRWAKGYRARVLGWLSDLGNRLGRRLLREGQGADPEPLESSGIARLGEEGGHLSPHPSVIVVDVR